MPLTFVANKVAFLIRRLLGNFLPTVFEKLCVQHAISLTVKAGSMGNVSQGQEGDCTYKSASFC